MGKDGGGESGAARSVELLPPRGEAGFGYDPIFQPEGHARTFGEMSAEEKHGVDWQKGEGLSHRARAFVLLSRACLAPGS